MIRGVIIDLDGTLVDSKEALFNHYLEFLKSFGHKGSREEFNTLNRPLAEVVKYLQTKYHLPDRDLLYQYTAGLPKIPPLKEGVKSFFHFARLNDLKLALATSASLDYVEPILEHYDLTFDAILPESKDKFAEGLKALKLPSEEVVHIDDDIAEPDWHKLIKSIISINYQTLYRGDNLKIEIVPMPDSLKLTQEEQSQADLVWNNAVKENPHLFNGKILQFISLENGTLKGAFAEYKHFLAKFRGLPLNLTAVCLSGITSYQNQLLIAKRSASVSQYQNAYELVPAGSFDDTSSTWEAHITKELEEEASIKLSQISKMTLHSVVFDKRDDIVEIVAAIELNKGEFKTTSETTEIRLYQPEDLYLDFVPFSHYLIMMMDLN